MKPDEHKVMTDSQVPRITGLLVIEVRKSNPNGDPERESSPRQRPDAKGEISPVSIKRKLRDLMEEKEEILWNAVRAELTLPDGDQYEILESRERGWKELKEKDETKRATEAWERTSQLMNSDFPCFKKRYWDARLFGNTFLEKAKEESGIQNTIRSGVAHFAVGVSVAPIEIEFSTWTKKAPAEAEKTRGMAPMAFRVVKHGLYTVPFFVNPTQARKTGCSAADVEIMFRLLKYAYPHTRSVIRTQVEIIHAHTVQHKNPLGSFSDFALLDALAPKRVPDADRDRPSESIADYSIPTWEEVKDKRVRADKNVKWNEVGDYTDYAL
jgi:Cas7 group CRISPR-associated protein Csh2